MLLFSGGKYKEKNVSIKCEKRKIILIDNKIHIALHAVDIFNQVLRIDSVGWDGGRAGAVGVGFTSKTNMTRNSFIIPNNPKDL